MNRRTVSKFKIVFLLFRCHLCLFDQLISGDEDWLRKLDWCKCIRREIVPISDQTLIPEVFIYTSTTAGICASCHVLAQYATAQQLMCCR